MRGLLRAAQDAIAPIDWNAGPLLTGAVQTRLSWARLVESRDELPPVYRPVFDALPHGDPFPHVVLTPKYEGFIRRETEKLVCCLDGVLHILENRLTGLNHTAYTLDKIHHVQVGMVLLKGWMTVTGIDGSSDLASTVLKYNTVTDRLFVPFLNQIRNFDQGPASGSGQRPDLRAERRKFDYLLRRNFKFMNYARNTILDGERVICSALQPDIPEVVFRVFGRAFTRTLAAAHILILTDRELIVIEDETKGRSQDEIKYGGIWNYMPLRQITSLWLEPKDETLLELSVEFAQGDRLRWLFETGSRPEIHGVLDQLAALASAVYIK